MTQTPSKGKRFAGMALTGVVGLGLIASAVAKFVGPAPLLANFEKYHLTAYRVPVGVVELVVALLFLVKRTSSLGTLLVTGYFGGAIVAHLTTAEPWEMIPPIVLGAMAWAGNAIRNPSMFESLKRS